MGGELACIDFIDDIDDIAAFEVAEQRRAFDFVLPARAVVVVDAHERQEVGGQPVGVRPAERRIVGEPGERGALARTAPRIGGQHLFERAGILPFAEPLFERGVAVGLDRFAGAEPVQRHIVDIDPREHSRLPVNLRTTPEPLPAGCFFLSVTFVHDVDHDLVADGHSGGAEFSGDHLRFGADLHRLDRRVIDHALGGVGDGDRGAEGDASGFQRDGGAGGSLTVDGAERRNQFDRRGQLEKLDHVTGGERLGRLEGCGCATQMTVGFEAVHGGGVRAARRDQIGIDGFRHDNFLLFSQFINLRFCNFYAVKIQNRYPAPAPCRSGGPGGEAPPAAGGISLLDFLAGDLIDAGIVEADGVQRHRDLEAGLEMLLRDFDRPLDAGVERNRELHGAGGERPAGPHIVFERQAVVFHELEAVEAVDGAGNQRLDRVVVGAADMFVVEERVELPLGAYEDAAVGFRHVALIHARGQFLELGEVQRLVFLGGGGAELNVEDVFRRERDGDFGVFAGVGRRAEGFDDHAVLAAVGGHQRALNRGTGRIGQGGLDVVEFVDQQRVVEYAAGDPPVVEFEVLPLSVCVLALAFDHVGLADVGETLFLSLHGAALNVRGENALFLLVEMAEVTFVGINPRGVDVKHVMPP
nr:MAG TPA: hypothetical protein [Caudoviricetes sp.]